MKKAFITGITGQDGSYLAELLVSKGYKVIGLDVQTSPNHTIHLNPIIDQITIIEGDLNNTDLIKHIITSQKPDEIYNLASISYIPSSWDSVNQNIDINARAVANLLETIRQFSPESKMYQASSSEMFGVPEKVPQDINTAFAPQNPYAAAKAFAHWLTNCYRSLYHTFTVSGILYNHESPRRPNHFVTRKITTTVAQIKFGLKDSLALGNLKAKRDWGFAGDYVKAMWLMLQQVEPEDFVIGSGKLHSVAELCDLAFSYVGLDYRDFVVQDPKLYRQIEHYDLVADPTEAEEKLGWKPEVNFPELVHQMVEHDIFILKKQLKG